jgi:hypothetical protein
VDAFLAALREGDFDALVGVLGPDVLLRDDASLLPAGPVPRGTRAVAGHVLTFSRGAQFARPATVNGAAGLAISRRGG